MLEDLFPYNEYKDSGLPCFGQIPTHWKVLRNGQIFSQRNQTGYPDLPILEVSLKTGVRVRDFANSKRKQIMSDREKYKRAGKGDIAYNMMRMWQGAVGVAPVDGLVSPAYVVASPFSEVDSRYYAYLFRTQAYMNEVNKYSRGIVADRNRLYWDGFKQMPSIFPPGNEQKKIADFLDAHGRKVSRLVKSKKRQIESLKELKQAVINNAVTRGVNSEEQLKPSSIDWVGDIPEHWEIKKLGQVSKITLSGLDKKSYENQKSVKLCNYVDVYQNDYITANIDFMQATASEEEIRNLTLKKGDIIITKDSESWDDIAVPSFVTYDLNNVVCAYHLAIIRNKDINIENEFLYSAFRSQYVAVQYKLKAKGVTRYGLSYQSIRDIIIFIPPIEEQLKIINFINSSIKNIDILISKIGNEIDLIAEYRKRLISDVVTGRVDIQHIDVEIAKYVDSFDDDELNDDNFNNEEVADLEECEV